MNKKSKLFAIFMCVEQIFYRNVRYVYDFKENCEIFISLAFALCVCVCVYFVLAYKNTYDVQNIV